MGEGREEALRGDFDRSMKVEFHGANVTSDAGLCAFRKLDEVLGSTDIVAALLVDARTGLNPRHTLLAQFRQSVYSRLAGYEDTDDAVQWCRDSSNRQGVGRRAEEKKQPRPVKRVEAALVLPQLARRGLYWMKVFHTSCVVSTKPLLAK